MKTKISLLLIMLLAVVAGKAQTFNISGSVSTETMEPVVLWPVTIESEQNSWPYIYEVVLTDSAGTFRLSGTISDTTVLQITVSTPDCNQIPVDTSFSIATGQSATASLVICDPVPEPCRALFYSVPEGGTTQQNTFRFYNTSTGAYTQLFWTFGDGGTSSEPSPVHTFTQGEWNVCLSISDTDSTCSDIYCETIVVGQSPCTNGFDTTISGFTVTLNGWTSSGGPAEYAWVFGDGSSGSGQSATHTYASSGYYTVTLVTLDSNNCTASSSKTITLEADTCSAGFDWIPDPADPLTVHFNDESAGDINAWKWNFGDDTASTLQNPDHTFASAGTYEVCLTVYLTDTGFQSTFCQQITIGNSVSFPVYGQVLANFFPADSIAVSLYKTIDDTLTPFDTAFVTESGAYAFYAVLQGTYILKADLKPTSSLYEEFLPTYSGNTLLWENSVPVEVNQPVGGADIMLVAKPVLTAGSGNIRGAVQWDDGMKNGLNAGINGVTVYLFSTQNVLIQAAYTDNDGTFAFSGIPDGDYVLRPEITGLPVTPYALTIGENSVTVQGIVFTVGENGIQYGIEELLPEGVSGIGLPSPNPVHGEAAITIETTRSLTIEIRIADCSGRIVALRTANLDTGYNRLTITAGELSRGMYTLLLGSNNTFIARRIVVL